MDPFYEIPTLVMICDVIDPITRQNYNRDPRWIARKAEMYLKNTGVGDTAYFGAEAEFFIFDNVRFDQNQHSGLLLHRRRGGALEFSGREGDNLGYRPRYKEGYFPVPPTDHYQDAARQDGGDDDPVRHEHRVPSSRSRHRRAVRNRSALRHAGEVGRQHDAVQVHHPQRGQSARQDGDVHAQAFVRRQRQRDAHASEHLERRQAAVCGRWLCGLEPDGLNYIGGLLKHARALSAIIAPTTNSYKRLVPGYEAPVNLAYSRRNRSAACRIPMYSASPKAKRVEFRPPDPSANPYLAFAAMLMAGLDGVLNKLEPGEPLDKDIYDLSPEEMKSVPSMPASLEEALDCLEEDHDFLLKGDVFSEDLIETFIDYKRKNEADAIRLRPHPV